MSAPISHTCPEIDRQQRINNQLVREIQDVIKCYQSYSINDLISIFESAKDRLEEIDSFLEEMRESNDELRKWGTEMEDKVAELQEEMSTMVYSQNCL